MAIIEGYWDCPYCGNKAIRGSVRTCPSCGRTRAAETKFYMLDTKPVEDEKAIDKRADWFCPYCDSYNPADAVLCKNCGHEREDSDASYFEVRQREEKKQREKDEEFAQLTRSAPAQTSSTRRSVPRIAIAVVLILAIVLSGVFLLAPKNKDVTVLDKYWERSVSVEAYRLVEDSGWSLPKDAVELLRSAREIHHYDQVLDHYETVTVPRTRQVLDGYDTYTTYEDMGNGFFESVEHSTPRYRTEYYTETREEPVYRSVPVYQTKYYYKIWTWVYDRTDTADGTDDPYWPQISDSGNERISARAENYTVTCGLKKDRVQTYDCEYEIWSAMEIGKSYSITVQMGDIIELK